MCANIVVTWLVHCLVTEGEDVAAVGPPEYGLGDNNTGRSGNSQSTLGFSEVQASNGVNMVSDMSSF